MALQLTSPPAEEPITAAEVKVHSRVSGAAEDPLLTQLIGAARRRAEADTKLAFVTQAWTWYLDAFPRFFELPLNPVQSVTAIKYLDDAGVEQTLDSAVYRSDLFSRPARVTTDFGQTWPTSYPVANAVRLEFVAGFGTAADVPDNIKAGLYIAVNDLYDNRGSIVVGTVAARLPQTALDLMMSDSIRSV